MKFTAQKDNTTPSVFQTGLAFRPFFWLGSLFAVIAFVVWAFFWQGQPLFQPEGGMIWWHQHEMLFGFVAAIIVGFLLTAVQTWTGLPSLSGPKLWLLVGLWLAARVLLAYPSGLSAYVLMVIDLLFLLSSMAVMASLVIRAKKWRNLVFVPVLLWLSLANLAMHWGKITTNAHLVSQSAQLTVWLIIALITVIAGRVIPFFTSRALTISLKPVPASLEKALIASTATLLVLQSARTLDVTVPAWLFIVPLVLISVLSLNRLRYWQPQRTAGHPLLWGLHISYGFIILGAVLWIGSELTLLSTDLALHTLTIGAILAIILAMIARVSLGHTGRPLQAKSGLSFALACIFLAALIRGLFLLFWSQHALLAYQTSLLLCIIAFSWFMLHYTIPLWTARPDHKPG